MLLSCQRGREGGMGRERERGGERENIKLYLTPANNISSVLEETGITWLIEEDLKHSQRT